MDAVTSARPPMSTRPTLARRLNEWGLLLGVIGAVIGFIIGFAIGNDRHRQFISIPTTPSAPTQGSCWVMR